MRITATMKAIVVATEVIPAHDGYKERYKIALAQGSEVASLSCSKDVIDARPVPFKEYGVQLQMYDYDGKINMQAVGIAPIPPTAAKQ